MVASVTFFTPSDYIKVSSDLIGLMTLYIYEILQVSNKSVLNADQFWSINLVKGKCSKQFIRLAAVYPLAYPAESLKLPSLLGRCSSGHVTTQGLRITLEKFKYYKIYRN